ncbi:integrase, catalytic region, zinc finger, CCHC-type containing protein [Tanacetum coccineum]
MYLDLKKNYWWPGMKRDCVKCVEKCLTCLKVKSKHQNPYGKIQPLEIPVWKWEKITMDFVTKLPRKTKKHDEIWVIVYRLTKSAHFIPIRENMPVHNTAYHCHSGASSLETLSQPDVTTNLKVAMLEQRKLTYSCSELGSELKTSELDTSELKTSEYSAIKIIIILDNSANYTMADMNIPANDAPAEQDSVKQMGAHRQEAFTSSSMIPAIYIQQFWDTMCFNSSIGLYNCQLDEQWFNLHKDLLRDALDITPTNDNNPFVAPPSSDTVIEYVNTLGYPCTLRNMSAMSAKTSCASDPLGKNLTTASRRKKKTAHLLIPSVRFTKLIFHHLKTKHNIHPRTGSPLHYSHDENVLNTLRFVGKDGREIFEHGMEDKGGAIESPKATKVTKPKAAKVTKPAGDKAPKPTSSQPPKPTPAQTEPSKKEQGKKHKLVKEKSDAPSLAKQAKADVQGKGKEKVIDEKADHDLLTLHTPKQKSPADQFIFQRRTPMPIESSGHAESPSLDAECSN